MLSFYPIYIKTLFLRGKKIENAHFQGKKRTLLGKKNWWGEKIINFALGNSETCTVSVRRAPDINDKHYFLRASPTDKFALGNSSKGLIDRSNLVGETGRWWAKGSKSETGTVSQKSPSAHADCASQVPPKFLPCSSHFSADENRRRKERTKEQWGRHFCTEAWRCVLKWFSP